jgi:anti-sigma-K factor RskA
MTTQQECGFDAQAYVTGTLDAAERQKFMRHLQKCPECREQTEELQRALRALPLMASAPASSGRRPSMRSEIQSDVRARAARAAALSEGSPPPARAHSARAQSKAPPARIRLGRLSLTRQSLVGVGALGLAVIMTLIFEFTATSTETIQPAIGWSDGSATLTITGGHGVLTVSGMPAAPTGDDYEVWVQHGTGTPDATTATFDVDSAGSAVVDVPGDLTDVTRLMVSAEPTAGSQVLTSTPVLIATLD